MHQNADINPLPAEVPGVSGTQCMKARGGVDQAQQGNAKQQNKITQGKIKNSMARYQGRVWRVCHMQKEQALTDQRKRSSKLHKMQTDKP